MFRYSDFVFMKDEQGNYKFVDCSKFSHRLWKDIDSWKEFDKNDKIIVFVYQGKILGDTFFFTLAFTTEENFENRFNDNFDFNKICKIGTEFEDFLNVKDFLINKFGYKEENIFEESNNINQKYKLGIFNI